MAAKRGEMTSSARDGRKFLNDVSYEAVESTRRDYNMWPSMPIL